ncbi:MAG TPA: pyrroline-5-carboxylate reductase [Gammaproteobacteria bacterium]
MDRKVLLIGFGNMGQALVRGWLERGIAPARIRVVDPVDASRAAAGRLGIDASETVDERALAARPDAVVIAVKPHQVEDAVRPLAPLADGGTLFVSIAAGKTITSLTRVLGERAAVVRAMPNTPAAIGRGMTVMTPSAGVAPAQRALADELLGAVGSTAWIDDEGLMDAVTAVSGSGPAYVFLLIECLTRAGTKAGLDPELAERLATATVAGAGAYAERSGEPAAELRRRVTSPNGTTEAALRVLMGDGGLDGLLERAVRAAADRSRELSAA